MALLQVTGVHKHFGAMVAISDVSFAVQPGQIFGIIGPNGAGKTTLINMISGVLQPTSGRISFDSRPLQGLEPWDVSALGISRTFQIVRLYHDLPVMENLVLAQHLKRRPMPLANLLRLPAARAEERAMRERADDLLKSLDLARYREHRAGDLSNAEQRRLQLAMALAAGSRLVLLDEPAAGLDRHEVEAFRDLVRHLVKTAGQTFVLIEHNVGLVMSMSDRILVLNFGQMIAEGTPDEVRSNPEVIRAYLGQVTASA